MLQQTRASVVIPYFERWLSLFPDVKALAEAPLERVIKAWEGLGYYSRARNLHKGAQQIVERFGGEVPAEQEDLESICGLGPYTVAAILSFGFQQRAAAIDGNVMRVLARFFLIEENICKQSVKRKIFDAAEALLDSKEPWTTAEALIELGAMVCTPKPQCGVCPLQKKCLGQHRAEWLPIKNKEVQITLLHRTVALIESEEKILVKKGEVGKVMADLYEFPYFEMGEERWTRSDIAKAIQSTFNLEVVILEQLPRIAHTFTRFKAHLYPVRCSTRIPKQIAGHQWVSHTLLPQLPFSSGHRRILSL